MTGETPARSADASVIEAYASRFQRVAGAEVDWALRARRPVLEDPSGAGKRDPTHHAGRERVWGTLNHAENQAGCTIAARIGGPSGKLNAPPPSMLLPTAVGYANGYSAARNQRLS